MYNQIRFEEPNFWEVMFCTALNSDPLGKESQTRGPRTTCDTPDTFVRPANIPKNYKTINFVQIYLILRAFLENCGPQKLFLFNCGSRSIVSLE